MPQQGASHRGLIGEADLSAIPALVEIGKNREVSAGLRKAAITRCVRGTGVIVGFRPERRSAGCVRVASLGRIPIEGVDFVSSSVAGRD